MSDYGKGSRRCPEDWRKVHRNWPFKKKRKAIGVSTAALLKKLGKRSAVDDVDIRDCLVIDVCGYDTPVRRVKRRPYKYKKSDGL